jgi:Predicted membrane protein (DUF2306)
MPRAPMSDWLIPAGLLFLGLIPGAAGTARLVSLAHGGPLTAANAHFFAQPLPVILHVVGALTFSILGAFQFAPGLRRRHLRLHRITGRLALPAGIVVALSGIWMALYYQIVPADHALLHGLRLTFGVLMLISLVLSLEAILRRDIPRHRAWVMRGYAIGMGAGTQALILLPVVVTFGLPAPLPYALLMGAGWVVNLGVVEVLLRRQKPRNQPRQTLTTG